MVIVEGTPLERHDIGKHRVTIKREDLACKPPGPPFSKMRGVMARLEKLKEEGVISVAYVETSISMAGWGVAYGCHVLGLRCIIYDPQYAADRPVDGQHSTIPRDSSGQLLDLLPYHRQQWARWGAELRPIPAGRAKVNYFKAKKELKGTGTVLLPLGLPFNETILATAEEFNRYWTTQIKKSKPRSIVVNIGSGTIMAGIIRATHALKEDQPTVYGVMGRTGSITYRKEVILKKGFYDTIVPGGLIPLPKFRIVDPGWEYTYRSDYPCPFPCHPYYDRKAWQWLVLNVDSIQHPVLFWNIGREFENPDDEL